MDVHCMKQSYTGPLSPPPPLSPTLLVEVCGDGNAASMYLVNIRRYGFATHAHALTINQITILAKGQSAYDNALLGCYHCT